MSLTTKIGSLYALAVARKQLPSKVKKRRQPEDEEKRPFVPMLPDGLPEAIRRIRRRKGMSQAQAAVKGGVKAYQWSRYETGGKRLSLDELSIVSNGLGVTRTDLWNEKYEAEKPYYKGPQPGEIGEEAPQYGMPMVIAVLQSLFEMDSHKLPPEWQKTFNDRRNGLLSSFANDLREADDLKDLYSRLMKTDESRTSHAVAGDREDTEDSNGSDHS